MKIRAIVFFLLASTAFAAFVSTARADEQSKDYARFEKWLYAVHEVAPRYNVKLDGNEAEEEFFYLYCWQSDDHSIVHAILNAREAWQPGYFRKHPEERPAPCDDSIHPGEICTEKSK